MQFFYSFFLKIFLLLLIYFETLNILKVHARSLFAQIYLFIEISFFNIYKYLEPDKPSSLIFIQFLQV